MKSSCQQCTIIGQESRELNLKQVFPLPGQQINGHTGREAEGWEGAIEKIATTMLHTYPNKDGRN